MGDGQRGHWCGGGRPPSKCFLLAISGRRPCSPVSERVVVPPSREECGETPHDNVTYHAPAQAAAWLGHLNDWYQDYGHLVRARTYRGASTIAPAWVRANQTWWFTHDRLRKAYRLLERLSRAGTLFTYLRHEFAGLDIAATTNRIEGGTNAQLRLILRAHRGMSEEHQKRAIEWYLYLHSESPVSPGRLIRPEHHTPTRIPAHTAAEQSDGPEEYGTAATAEEGLWARSGRAGRP